MAKDRQAQSECRKRRGQTTVSSLIAISLLRRFESNKAKNVGIQGYLGSRGRSPTRLE